MASHVNLSPVVKSVVVDYCATRILERSGCLKSRKLNFFDNIIEVKTMSKVCQITGKKAITGNNVSHSKRRTKRKFNVNVFNRKFYWVEQDQWIRLTVSASGLRLINRIGLDAALKKAAQEGHLTEIKTIY